MPDGKFALYEFHNPRIQAAYAADIAETRAELIEAGKERALAAIDEALDAMDEIEAEAPGAMRHARLLPADARSEVGGTE